MASRDWGRGEGESVRRMAGRKKKTAAGRPTAASLAKSGTSSGAMANVVRDERGVSFSIDLNDVPRPSYKLAVSCGRARLREGTPELLLAQLHPLQERQVTRVLVVRYEPRRFCHRAELNEPFRASLEEYLAERNTRGEAGHFGRVLDSADATGSESATVDVEAEMAFRNGDFGTFVFVSSYARDMHLVLSGKSGQLPIEPVVEATMPTRVMADLLLSWKEVAAEMAS